MILKVALAALSALAVAGSAQAMCNAPAPAAGTVIHGPVLQVIDGDHICVATGAASSDWAELLIRGADEGRVVQSDRLGAALLMSVAFAKTADCMVAVDAMGRKVADCRIDGKPLVELMRRPGAIEAATAWVRPPQAADAPIQLASR